MNTPATFELAFRELIARRCADTIPAAWVHCATRPADLFNEDGRRVYPQVVVKAMGKALDDNASAWVSGISVTVATDAAEDVDGSKRSFLYGEIETLFEGLLDGAKDGDAADELSRIVQEDIPTFCFGGFVPEQGDPSEAGEGLFVGTFSGSLHYEY